MIKKTIFSCIIIILDIIVIWLYLLFNSYNPSVISCILASVLLVATHIGLHFKGTEKSIILPFVMGMNIFNFSFLISIISSFPIIGVFPLGTLVSSQFYVYRVLKKEFKKPILGLVFYWALTIAVGCLVTWLLIINIIIYKKAGYI